MNPVNVISMTITSLLFVSTVASAASHPSSGYPAHDLGGAYGGLPASLSTGDYLFLEEADRQDRSQLSQSELYMLVGTSRSAGRGGLSPWYMSVYFAASAYHQSFGQLPSTLGLAELQKLYPSAPVEKLDVYRNPLTGQWPRLNASAHSPGDMYLKVLSQSDMAWFGERHSGLSAIWFQNSHPNPDDIRAGMTPDTARKLGLGLAGPPIYMRLYGSSGVLKTDLLSHVKSN
jgi:hypothetical protein